MGSDVSFTAQIHPRMRVNEEEAKHVRSWMILRVSHGTGKRWERCLDSIWKMK